VLVKPLWILLVFRSGLWDNEFHTSCWSTDCTLHTESSTRWYFPNR
jgi:hypothetical protein